MVVVDVLNSNSAAAVADELFGDADLQTFFDKAALEVKDGGGGGEEEELEWLSNKDAFPALETMAPVGERPRTKGVRRPRQVVAWSGRWCQHCGTESTPLWCDGQEGRCTLCNTCGVRYRSGRLLPEYRPAKSPTFSPELHSNIHRRIIERRRRREESMKASDGKEKGGEEPEWLLNKGAFPAVETMAPAGVRPRTKGVWRPQRWCQHCGTEETPLWREGPKGRGTLCNACGVRYRSGRLVPEYRLVNSPTFSPGLHSNIHSRVIEMCRRREESDKASPAADSDT
ncbi:GATA transcription factor 1-like [Phragmites australis]|uniref:GATA transcription factor 1-like n=1 Tax=Phragmites australis TaxID=29695 RepID=UPI002D79C5EE|nr:GATA transcription factor 1-like [Phragmites australis]